LQIQPQFHDIHQCLYCVQTKPSYCYCWRCCELPSHLNEYGLLIKLKNAKRFVKLKGKVSGVIASAHSLKTLLFVCTKSLGLGTILIYSSKFLQFLPWGRNAHGGSKHNNTAGGKVYIHKSYIRLGNIIIAVRDLKGLRGGPGSFFWHQSSRRKLDCLFVLFVMLRSPEHDCASVMLLVLESPLQVAVHHWGGSVVFKPTVERVIKHWTILSKKTQQNQLKIFDGNVGKLLILLKSS
jgi:hypothetical protein